MVFVLQYWTMPSAVTTSRGETFQKRITLFSAWGKKHNPSDDNPRLGKVGS